MSETTTVDVSTAIKGLEELDRKVQKTYTRKALRAACKVTLKAARSAAPVASGLLQRNTKIRSAKSNRNYLQMTVGVGKKNFTGSTFYAAFEMFGHKVGKRQLGDARKQVPGNDFLTTAYKDTAAQAVEVFRTTITELIEKNVE